MVNDNDYFLSYNLSLHASFCYNNVTETMGLFQPRYLVGCSQDMSHRAPPRTQLDSNAPVQNYVPSCGTAIAEPALLAVFSCWKSRSVGPSLSEVTENQEQKQTRPFFSLYSFIYYMHSFNHFFSKDLFGSYHYAWCRAVFSKCVQSMGFWWGLWDHFRRPGKPKIFQ